VSDWRAEIEISIRDFATVPALAGSPIEYRAMDVEFLAAPHTPATCLPRAKTAIYGFRYGGEWLEIGRAGPRSNPRYTYQHYCPTGTESTLAKSLLNDADFAGSAALAENAGGQWLKASTCRGDAMLVADRGIPLPTFPEALLHLRLKPRYEEQTNLLRQRYRHHVKFAFPQTK